jgi:hypothetical protein
MNKRSGSTAQVVDRMYAQGPGFNAQNQGWKDKQRCTEFVGFFEKFSNIQKINSGAKEHSKIPCLTSFSYSFVKFALALSTIKVLLLSFCFKNNCRHCDLLFLILQHVSSNQS